MKGTLPTQSAVRFSVLGVCGYERSACILRVNGALPSYASGVRQEMDLSAGSDGRASKPTELDATRMGLKSPPVFPLLRKGQNARLCMAGQGRAAAGRGGGWLGVGWANINSKMENAGLRMAGQGREGESRVGKSRFRGHLGPSR